VGTIFGLGFSGDHRSCDEDESGLNSSGAKTIVRGLRRSSNFAMRRSSVFIDTSDPARSVHSNCGIAAGMLASRLDESRE